MKHLSKSILAAFAVAILTCAALVPQGQAVELAANSTITFTGSVTLNNTSAGNSTNVTGFFGLGAGGNPQVAASSGSFLPFAPAGTTAVFTAPYFFNSGPQASLWTAGGFTFNLTFSAMTSQGIGPGGLGFVTAGGTGFISGNGFTSTFGTWSFSTQDPGAGSPAMFSFSAASNTVPEGGATLALLGVALVGVEAFRRKLATAKRS